jgi:ankyrin repeat protein
MNEYNAVLTAVTAGDISALAELAQMIDGFPTGKDDFVQQHWLRHAVACGSVEVVAWMIEHGAPVVFTDDDGYTVLHAAIECSRPDKHGVISLLIAAGADINAHGVNDWTPAHMAAAWNDVAALRLLHEAGADFSIRTRIDEYATPLEEAMILGRSAEAVAYLKGVTGKAT